MVSLAQVKASNARIKSSLPSGLVAVFLGGTSGIGEYALKEFAKDTVAPRIYFIGRSQEAADRITRECQALNKAGTYTFIKSDTSLIKNVDQVCEQIKAKEESINLLFLTQGTLSTGIETSEDLHLPAALLYYCRTRFTLNLLPQLRRATSLRRVVSVAIGTKEGEIDVTDLDRRNAPLIKARAHGATIMTFTLEHQAKLAPEVSFIHEFPGWVRSNVARDNKGFLWTLVKYVITPVLGPFFMVKDEESGQRSVFAATSAAFPAAVRGADGVSLTDDADSGDGGGGVNVVRGTDGQVGSGMYSVDYDGMPASPEVEQLLARLRSEGADEKVWAHIDAAFQRITGKTSTAEK